MTGLYKRLFEHAEEVTIYRVLSIFTFLAHPFYYWMYITFIPGVYDPLWQRIVLSMAAIIPLSLELTNTIGKRQFMKMSNTSLYLNTFWFLFIIAMNQFRAEYVIGYYVVLTAVGFSFNNMRSLIIYTGLALPTLIITSIVIEDKIVHPVPLIAITTGIHMLSFIILFIKLKYQDLLRLSNASLKQKNEEILASIKYAKRIQQAILPNENYMQKSLKDYFVLYLPEDIVSGDFYWMEEVGNYILFATVDCTGHGVPGAFMSILGDNGLKKIVMEQNVTRPDMILNKLTEHVIKSTTNSSDVKDGMDVAICRLNPATLELDYAGAYNPLYYMQDNELKIIKATKRPVGRFKRRKLPDFQNHTVQLKKGDVVYVFSDGYADQFGGPEKLKFTYRRFRDLIQRIHNKPMNEQKELLMSEYENWKQNEEQLDDICLMGVRV